MLDPLQRLYAVPEAELLERIRTLRERLGDRVLILGHHYQREEVIRFADITGDSLKLSQQAAEADAEHIVFCGVHFMAETADILTRKEQKVLLPDPAAGCSMADMAALEDVVQAWRQLGDILPVERRVTPVTYINSSAALKAFCGRNGGIVCTSSNARQVLEWAWERREKVLFFPDEHLGRNTAAAMGLPFEAMIVWDPSQPLGGNRPEDIARARIILWKGFCSVHQLFKPEHVRAMREKYPDVVVLAHPECSHEVCALADVVGSTEAIIREVARAPAGSRFAIGTELNLVNRLRLQHRDKAIHFLSPIVCMCSTMFRTDPQHLYSALEDIAEGRRGNRIVVPEDDKADARTALSRMLALA